MIIIEGGDIANPSQKSNVVAPPSHTLKTPGSDLTRKGSHLARPISGSDWFRNLVQTDTTSEPKWPFWLGFRVSLTWFSGRVWPRNGSGGDLSLVKSDPGVFRVSPPMLIRVANYGLIKYHSCSELKTYLQLGRGNVVLGETLSSMMKLKKCNKHIALRNINCENIWDNAFWCILIIHFVIFFRGWGVAIRVPSTINIGGHNPQPPSPGVWQTYLKVITCWHINFFFVVWVGNYWVGQRTVHVNEYASV